MYHSRLTFLGVCGRPALLGSVSVIELVKQQLAITVTCIVSRTAHCLCGKTAPFAAQTVCIV